ncbi:MAG TPA: hypothetical protein PLX89_16900 [Verrucomicrobiota bacterium]|nr:hypothetical protein [Verrucomicrobiales bacterium]HRI14676.1 hypothetical protein [Verrucomicrobiota bacterium]
MFAPNIKGKGRWWRGLMAVLLLGGAPFGLAVSVWLGAVLAAVGGFVAFEALRGWCFLRAGGIKTRI